MCSSSDLIKNCNLLALKYTHFTWKIDQNSCDRVLSKISLLYVIWLALLLLKKLVQIDKQRLIFTIRIVLLTILRLFVFESLYRQHFFSFPILLNHKLHPTFQTLPKPILIINNYTLISSHRTTQVLVHLLHHIHPFTSHSLVVVL